MVREILDWLDKKTDELEMDKPMDFVKCVGIGFTEGFIDGSFICATVLLGTGITCSVLNKIKK